MEVKEIATTIVNTLQEEGHTAYFAGGWVRDLIMGHPSDDIDIATSASPEEITALFPKTIAVGRAFGVVVVLAEGHQFEVSTFRRDLDYRDGRRPTGFEPSSPEEDAKRRDFTINGMFYDPTDDALHDFVGGKADIAKGVIRTIGDPFERFFEDRLRMIRAVRFAARFRFHIDPETKDAIAQNAPTLFPAVSMERIWQELNKMRAYPSFDHSLVELHRLGLLAEIFPRLKGTPLDTVKKRVACFERLPTSAPTVAFLLPLFPEMSEEDLVDICRSLRMSNRDMKFALFLRQIQTLENPDAHAWSHIYAHPDSELAIEILAALEPNEKERTALLDEHAHRRSGLAPHIKRIVEKAPVVTSADLKAEGIKPGKWMGELLAEAERTAIVHEHHTKEEVIKKLKGTPLWERAHD